MHLCIIHTYTLHRYGCMYPWHDNIHMLYTHAHTHAHWVRTAVPDCIFSWQSFHQCMQSSGCGVRRHNTGNSNRQNNISHMLVLYNTEWWQTVIWCIYTRYGILPSIMWLSIVHSVCTHVTCTHMPDHRPPTVPHYTGVYLSTSKHVYQCCARVQVAARISTHVTTQLPNSSTTDTLASTARIYNMQHIQQYHVWYQTRKLCGTCLLLRWCAWAAWHI